MPPSPDIVEDEVTQQRRRPTPPGRRSSLFLAAPGRRRKAGRRSLQRLSTAEIAARLRWIAVSSFAVLGALSPQRAAPAVLFAVWAGTVVYAAICDWLARQAGRARIEAVGTMLGDSAAIAAFCLVTGGLDSLGYPYFGLTVLGTAIRFGMAESCVHAVVNGALSVLLYQVAPSRDGIVELAAEIFFLWFVALLGGLLPHQSRDLRRKVVAERRRLVEDLRSEQGRRRELLRRLIHSEEEERKRVAGEIHDSLGKRLFELHYGLRQCEEQLGARDPLVAQVLRRLDDEACRCEDEIRAITNQLRPAVIDDFGFAAALKEYVDDLKARGEFSSVVLAIDPDVRVPDRDANVMLFRVLHEAVLNVRKHADARNVWIRFVHGEANDSRLEIRDDGVGFDPGASARRHFGIRYMHERAEACDGELVVSSAPGKGTAVMVVLPTRSSAVTPASSSAVAKREIHSFGWVYRGAGRVTRVH